MTKVVNNDKLVLILTEYGLRRIQEVAGTTSNISLTKIRIGSGDNYEYYIPDPNQEALKGDLGYEFYIYDKELLEDGLTVSFHTIIPEDVSNFEIREVGLYETHNGEDKLFAISTQQPFVKPYDKDFYFININYYIFLKSQNLASIYDQITLDIEHAQVTEPDLEELMRTFLFAQGNLISQINDNSTIIGYNRASQLYDKITENKKTYSYINTYANYATLLDFVESSDNIFSYWIFNYSRREGNANSIVDLSSNKYYLSTSTPINNLERVYEGFMSLFSFKTPDYFSLTSQIPLNLYNPETNIDLPFTMMFTLSPLETDEVQTLIAKSNYAIKSHTFEVTELPDRSIQVRLFSDFENYLTFKTVQNSIPSGAHALVITYDPYKREMTFYINSSKYVVRAEETGSNYTHMSELSSTLYAFTCAPKYAIYAQIDEDQNPIEPLFTLDGGSFVVYKGTDWKIQKESGVNKIFYHDNIASIDLEEGASSTDKMYGWIPESGVIVYDKIVYTKELPEDGKFSYVPTLYNSDYEIYRGTDFGVAEDVESGMYVIKFYQDGTVYDTVHDPEESHDLQPKTLYYFKYQMAEKTIYTNSKTNPVVLYEKNDQSFSVYTGDEWTIQNNNIYRLNQLATYDEEKNENIDSPDLTSYITNSNGFPTDYINSEVGLISIIKEALTDEAARIMALNLSASLGRNPYLGGF